MHYNAARDVNAISIAAVREFMAVQDRIRPALNCFSQEQHATNTDHRRRRRRVDLSRTSPPHPPRSLTICPRRKIANFSPRKIFQEQSIFRAQYKYNNKNINNINFVCNISELYEKVSIFAGKIFINFDYRVIPTTTGFVSLSFLTADTDGMSLRICNLVAMHSL